MKNSLHSTKIKKITVSFCCAIAITFILILLFRKRHHIEHETMLPLDKNNVVFITRTGTKDTTSLYVSKYNIQKGECWKTQIPDIRFGLNYHTSADFSHVYAKIRKGKLIYHYYYNKIYYNSSQKNKRTLDPTKSINLLFAVDLNNGKILWKKHLPPTLDKNLYFNLICGERYGLTILDASRKNKKKTRVLGIDLNNGKTIWEKKILYHEFFSAPKVSKKYFIFSDVFYTYLFEKTSGELKKIKGSGYGRLLQNELLYFTHKKYLGNQSNRFNVYLLNLNNLKSRRLFTVDGINPYVGYAVYKDLLIYGHYKHEQQSGLLKAYSIKKRHKLWQIKFGAGYYFEEIFLHDATSYKSPSHPFSRLSGRYLPLLVRKGINNKKRVDKVKIVVVDLEKGRLLKDGKARTMGGTDFIMSHVYQKQHRHLFVAPGMKNNPHALMVFDTHKGKFTHGFTIKRTNNKITYTIFPHTYPKNLENIKGSQIYIDGPIDGKRLAIFDLDRKEFVSKDTGRLTYQDCLQKMKKMYGLNQR